MVNPTSFTAKLLQARYFPSSTFREAGLGSNPSFVWRSILGAKDLIFLRSVLKVGSGESIRIWFDPWIPYVGDFKISSAIMPGLEETKVSNLFKSNSREWDKDLISDIFSVEDANRILRIPLSQTAMEDFWMWLEDNSGIYSVKSGYRWLCKSYNQPYHSVPGFNWSKLWSLAIPPKVKKFVWRLLHNCIPTLDNLRKFVDVDPMCPVCKSNFESVEHLIWSCPFSQSCWALSNIPFYLPVNFSIELKWKRCLNL